MRIGIIGLGVMSAPMAWHLVAAGHRITAVLNRSPLPAGLEAAAVESAAEVARRSEVVITVLSDTPDVERVLFGEEGVAAGLWDESLVVEMSSCASDVREARQEHLIGERNGAGQSCKIGNQINIEAVAEALVFASKAGCDPATVRAALMGGSASLRVLEVHGKRMISRAFMPGFRIRLHQKDLGLALESARALGVSLPNMATAQEMMNACSAVKAG
jgi:2-hydroxy-3-oxopropionate reductase